MSRIKVSVLPYGRYELEGNWIGGEKDFEISAHIVRDD
jgi:hypothetical protein